MSTATLPADEIVPTANDRMKESFGTWSWGSLAIAAALHFLLLALWPEMRAEDVSIQTAEMQQMDVTPEIDIPPPPEEIVRPAVPIISTDLNLTSDITIDPTTFDDNPVSSLPPPPVGQTNVSDQPAFTPYEVRPELRNRAEFQRALQRAYPPTLRDAAEAVDPVLEPELDDGLHDLLLHPAFRGAVSGFGVYHLVWGTHDLDRLLARTLRSRD